MPVNVHLSFQNDSLAHSHSLGEHVFDDSVIMTHDMYFACIEGLNVSHIIEHESLEKSKLDGNA
jgi:hypothetical protein